MHHETRTCNVLAGKGGKKKHLLHLVLKLTILLISGLPFFLWRERADIKIGSSGNKETV